LLADFRAEEAGNSFAMKEFAGRYGRVAIVEINYFNYFITLLLSLFYFRS